MLECKLQTLLKNIGSNLDDLIIKNLFISKLLVEKEKLAVICLFSMKVGKTGDNND